MIPFIYKQYNTPPPTPRPALVSHVFVRPSDAAHYFHARDCVISDFTSITGSNRCWHDFVLPMSHTVEPIKYALCALGSAHRRFLTSYFDSSTSCSAAEDLESIQKYNEAIMHMRPILMESSRDNIQITLICCMLFMCIENLNGRYADSARHLYAGCRLINSYRRDFPFQLQSSPGSDHHLFQVVSEMMHWFGQNLAVYSGCLLFLDIERDIQPLEIGNPHTPFANLKEAADMLMYVDSIYDKTIASEEFADEHSISPGSRKQPQQIGCARPIRSPNLVKAFKAIRKDFATWCSRFSLLKAASNVGTLPSADQREYALLSLHQALWTAFSKLEKFEHEYSKEDSNNILDRVEELFKLESDGSRPVFTFDGDLVSASSIVCSLCSDVDVQARSIALLRSMRRREGVWDSSEMAALHEKTFRAVEDKRILWEDLEWGVPQAIEQMSRLGLE